MRLTSLKKECSRRGKERRGRRAAKMERQKGSFGLSSDPSRLEHWPIQNRRETNIPAEAVEENIRKRQGKEKGIPPLERPQRTTAKAV